MPDDSNLFKIIDDDYKSEALHKTVQGIDADKDKAALSMDIGNASGADPWMVYKNYDEFARNRKAQIAQELVDKDPWLTSYVKSHPLASSVSKDDWANLANVSDTIRNSAPLGNGLWSGTARCGAEAAASTVEAFGQGLKQMWDAAKTMDPDEARAQVQASVKETQDYIKEKGLHTYYTAEQEKALNEALEKDLNTPQILGLFFGYLQAKWSWLLGPLHEEVSAPLEEKTGFPAEITDQIAGMAVAIGEAYGKSAQAKFAAGDRVKDTVDKVGVFAKSGEAPPVGVDPAIDQVHALDAQSKMKILDAIMDADDKTETKELSPELYNEFTKLQHANQNIYVRWAAVKALYGDKVPEADDGMLGWVQGIQNQFKDSAVTQRDIEIPLADWRAKVDPEINKLLHDDLLFQDGMTLKEAEEELKKEGPTVTQVPEEKFEGLSGEIRRPFVLNEIGDNEFAVMNEAGDTTSKISVRERDNGKTLIVKWDGAQDVAGLKTVLDQLKQKYPEAEEITGPKIPGMIALERALGEGTKVAVDMPFRFKESAIDTVRRSGGLEPLFAEAPAGWDVAEGGATIREPGAPRDLAAEGYVPVTEDVWVKPQIKEEWTAKEKELNDTINAVLNRIVGRRAPLEVIPARDIRLGRQQRAARGLLQLHRNQIPTLVWSLGTDRPGVEYEPLVTARHEALHFLREYGYVTPGEWRILSDAALKKDAKGENWLDKHGINERYWYADNETRIEEAIVHEFSKWEGGREEAKGALGRVFQKIKDIRDGVRDAIRQVFGHDLTAQDIFSRIERGAVARRGPADMPRTEGAFPVRLEEEPLIKPLGEEGPTFPPGSLLPKETYSKYMRAINAQREGDIQKMFGEAEREQRQRQTPEWKANALKMRSQVISDIGNRPDFLVSAFFRTGKWFGTDTHWMPKIDPKFLSAEQKKGIPSRFMAKGGLNPDDIAGDFGYSTGKALVDDMVNWETQRGDLQPAQFFEKMVKDETNRRMEQQYGKLTENIAKAAREHIISSEQFEILHQEAIRLAQLAGQDPPMDKAEFLRQAALRFNEKTGSKVSLQGLFRDLGKAGRDAEKAFFGKDYAAAFTAKMAQVHIMAESKLLRDFEKQRDRLDADLKMHRKQVTPGTPPEYSDWIHNIAFRIGRPPLRSIQNLEDTIAQRDYKTLRAFVDYKNGIGLPEGWIDYEVDFNPNLTVAEFLKDPDPSTGKPWTKNLDTMTVGEYKAVADSIRSLVEIGRKEGKSIKEGEVSDLTKVIGRLVKQMETLGKGYPAGKEPGWWRTMNAGLIQLHQVMYRIDRGNPGGEFSRRFIYPFIQREGEFQADVRRTSAKMKEINKRYKTNLKEKIDNDVFYEPDGMTKDKDGKPVIPAGGKEWLPMTRMNLRAVLLNMGNDSNLQRLAEGYHTTPEKIKEWADKHATKEDWKWAHDVGHEIFEDIIQKEADKMTMSMSGILVDRLPIGKVQTATAGELAGWYYPIIYDRTRGGGFQGGIEKAPPTRIRTAQGWQLQRTGSAGPVDLSIEGLPSQITRRLRDNHFRELVHESQKIMMHKDFQRAFSKYVGKEFTNLFEPYLRDVAGISGYTSATMKAWERSLENLRQRTIATMIGYKIGTVLKHGPTALVQSMHEAGIFRPDIYRAAGALFATNKYTMEANWKFMMHGGKVGDLDWGGSSVLQSRGAHWDQTVGASVDETLGKTSFSQRMQSWGSKPVAWSDMMSSGLLWWAKYDKISKENAAKGMTVEQAHTDAVNQADYAVIRTHGSTGMVSRPEFMRQGHFGMRWASSLYGFFNHIYNRYYEMAWMSREAAQAARRGDVGEAGKLAYKVTSNAMFYIVLPAVIEKLAQDAYLGSDKEQEDENDVWTWMASGVGHTLAGSVPVVRDIVYAMDKNHDPSIGIFGTPAKALLDTFRSVRKPEPNVGDALHYGINALGIWKGYGLTDQIGRWAKFVYNITAGEDNPESVDDWYRGLRTGSSQRPRR